MRPIDADEVMDALYDAGIELYRSEYEEFQARLNKIPTIDPKTLQPTTHWISVKDRPPDDGEEVICYCGNKDYPGCYGEIYILTFYTDTGWLLGDAVTHWMPKPKPPKEESDGAENGRS